MLTEQRFDIILKLLEERKSITVTELRELLDASESTVRRDITALDKAGKLTKVFGGAVALNHKVTAYEPTVAQKSELNKEEKKKIAKYAAGLITPDDFVYLDAGTTTGLMLEYLAGARAVFVTNAATRNWPILWATPPMILIPVISKRRSFLHTAIRNRLKTAPAIPNRIDDIFPNVKPDNNTRTTLMAKASFTPRPYRAMTVTRLANPSFTPGAPR